MASKDKHGKQTIPGAALDRLMRDRAMRPVDLEAASGVSRVTIWQIRVGRVREPDVQTLQRLADALEVPVAVLLGATTAVDGESVVRLFLDSGEAGRMMPPPSAAELRYLRKHGALFDGPAITPRGIAYVLLRLRESPEWERALAGV